MKSSIAITALILATIPAMAENCASITSNQDRLACYDLAAKPKAKIAAVKPSSTQQARWNYRAQLERGLLEIGISAEVAMETPNSSKIILMAYLSKATVYKLITDGRLLNGAKDAGFKTFDFMDIGNDGIWRFDLTKPGSCDRGLCWN